MTSSFSELVSHYLQDIAFALRHPQQAEASRPLGTGIPEPMVEQARAPGGTDATLPEANVDHLAGGSHVLEDDAAEPAAFLVFARARPSGPFRYRGVLDATAELTRFVESAYLGILERPADDAGRGNYVMLLREGALKPVDLIKTLATSDEFLNRPTRIVVVSQTSPWLAQQVTPVDQLDIKTVSDQ